MSKTWTTFVLLFGIAVIGSNALVLSPILTDVARDLGTTPTIVARAIAINGGASAISALLLGFSIDRYGVRTVLVACSMLLAAGTFGSAFATSWVWLCVAQAAAGLAAGAMLPAIYAVATTTGRPDEGARILGRVLTGWSLSLVVGVPVSALIAQHFGWHSSFVVLGCLSLLAALGFTTMPASDALVRENAATGVDGDAEIRPHRGLKIPGVPALLVAQFLFMTAFYGTYSFFGDYLRTVLHLSTSMAGLVVLSYGVGFGLATLGDGLLDRHGPAKVLPFALGLVAFAYATMPFVAVSLAGVFVTASSWGFANHFVLNTVVSRLSALGGPARGRVLGLNTATTYAGALVGPLMLGALYSFGGFAALATGASACVTIAAIWIRFTGRRR
ncbi:MFS transporter [Rhizobiaceae bacterium]|nr:MFS transporter [Rhizobiaceae bacterium]